MTGVADGHAPAGLEEGRDNRRREGPGLRHHRELLIEQPHEFRAGGLSWLHDPYMPGSQEVAEQGVAPYQAIDAHIIGGAGGRGKQTGDFFYGDNRRPFTESGMWGIIRVLPKPSCRR